MRKGVTPQYDLVANEGAVHEPLFVFKVIAGDVIGTGKGNSFMNLENLEKRLLMDALIDNWQLNIK